MRISTWNRNWKKAKQRFRFPVLTSPRKQEMLISKVIFVFLQLIDSPASIPQFPPRCDNEKKGKKFLFFWSIADSPSCKRCGNLEFHFMMICYRSSAINFGFLFGALSLHKPNDFNISKSNGKNVFPPFSGFPSADRTKKMKTLPVFIYWQS